MLVNFTRAAMAASLLCGAASGAWAAQEPAGPNRVQLRPIIDARLRYETVDQPILEAEGLTFRLRAGLEASVGALSLLAEAEGTAAPIKQYNAFPFPIDGEGQRRPGFATISDPENAELNRLQVQYIFSNNSVTLGRQRINLDDQRWVGSVGWRQNEQTFDAARGETKLGPIRLDLTYANGQRTIFGRDAGPRSEFEGDFIFAGLSSKMGPIDAKLFAYLLDYKEDFFLANSSQTYGAILSTSVPIGPKINVNLRVSLARQSDHGRNPFDYAASYSSLEGGATLAGFAVAAGWEQLGSDRGRAVQTPMATLHKFNGWADLFLATPAAGLTDAYVSISRKFERVELLPGLHANLAFHQFDSAAGDLEYGTEWDVSLGIKPGRIGILAKVADYDAKGFGVDTRKIWLQAEWAF